MLRTPEVACILQAGPRPKNTRLFDAICQNQDAKVRAHSWVMGVMEEILMDVESRHKKTEKSPLLLGGATMPEIAFAYFHHKFGSKAIVDEYIGSLNNTMLHFLKVPVFPQYEKTRLEKFCQLAPKNVI